MTNHMQKVLDGFTASERLTLLRVADAADGTTLAGRIMQAAAVAAHARGEGAVYLVEELDHLSAEERRAVSQVGAESDGVTPMSRILLAVATELRVRELEEDELFRGLERDRQADLDALHADHSLPGPDPSQRLTFHPETGEFRPEGTTRSDGSGIVE